MPGYEQLDASVSSSNIDSSPAGIAKDFFQSAAHTGIQSPYDGIRQLVNNVGGGDILPQLNLVDAPTPAEFGSANWHAQTLGSAAGLVGDLIVLKGAGRAIAPGLGRHAAHPGLLRSTASGVALGATYEGLFRPVDLDQNSLLEGRLKNAAVGAITFGTLHAAGTGLRFAGAATGNKVLSSVLKNSVGRGALAGAPAGYAHAEASSLIHEGKRASAGQIGESVYSFMFVGGALGAADSFLARGKTSQPTDSANARGRSDSAGRPASRATGEGQTMMSRTVVNLDAMFFGPRQSLVPGLAGVDGGTLALPASARVPLFESLPKLSSLKLPSTVGIKPAMMSRNDALEDEYEDEYEDDFALENDEEPVEDFEDDIDHEYELGRPDPGYDTEYGDWIEFDPRPTRGAKKYDPSTGETWDPFNGFTHEND